ncbi:hypothetical protein RISK_005309 [Rhodopirellula islandica]|uniref:Uncharacterized protein n=1 Tax=Rhodopirellula islandica TaxID=595434 RepID=A0A0J1B6M2_RHOIS|nr:hypothetical protein RISK_005309 [Rhodopirellula islandica]
MESESVETGIRLAAKEATEISLTEAVNDWPHLITDERKQVVIQGDEI